jgi:hypothetical protein
MLSIRACVAAVAGLPVAFAAAQPEQPARYDGHRAVRVEATTAREYQTILALSEDVLTCEGSGIGAFDVRMSPGQYEAFAGTGIRHQILLPDIQAHIDQIWADDARVRAGDDPSWFATYRSLAEINARMDQLAAAFPALATVSTIGNSLESRPIRMLRITGPGATTTRPAFIIQGTQHAREWVTPHCAMYIADRFLETYATDPQMKEIVDKLDFYFVPVVNPDGYEYSRTTNSQWRKNRRVNPGTTCRGVDLNRNWGFQWGYDNLGSSPDPCSGTFRGSAGFSEPELAPMKTLVDTLGQQNRLKVHWDIHANGQSILSCWGYTTNPPPDLALMNTLGQMIKTGMGSVRGLNYPYGQGSVILYLNNGNTRDYSYGTYGAMAWTIEMGGSSFQPSVSQILPLAQEALAGLVPVANYYIAQIPPPACYANCDASTQTPVLNVADFSCFLGKFAAGDPYANCDESTQAPVLNVADFSCFLGKFAAGCP